MAPRYLYGSSADAIASQEMGRDTARDQRFFQSLAQQRAAQQQLDNEMYRQAAFQASERERAEQMQRNRFSDRLALSRLQQQADLDYDKLDVQRELGLDRLEYLQNKTNPADVRMELENAKMQAEQQDIQAAAQRYQELQREKDKLRNALDQVQALPRAQKQFVEENSSAWIPFDNAGYRRQFTEQADRDFLSSYYPSGVPRLPKKATLEERIEFARPQIDRRLADVDSEIAALDKLGIPQYLRRSSVSAPVTTTASAPPPSAPRVAQARVIADAQAAIAQGKDPRWIIQQAQQKYGVDLTPYLR